LNRAERHNAQNLDKVSFGKVTSHWQGKIHLRLTEMIGGSIEHWKFSGIPIGYVGFRDDLGSRGTPYRGE
jgi:hypothetical protein